MELIDVYPKELICQRVPARDISFVEFGKEKIDKIVELKESCMFELGATIWDKFIQENPSVDPMSLAEHFQTGNPYLYRAVSDFTGVESIKDILYAHTNTSDETVDYKCFSELLIAVVSPGVLHISDIEFSNPFVELKPSERQSAYQGYKGLGLFCELVKRCEQYCNEHSLEKLCLTAAHISLVPLFQKNGFEVDDTPAGEHGMTHGSSIPMTKVVSNT